MSNSALGTSALKGLSWPQPSWLKLSLNTWSDGEILRKLHHKNRDISARTRLQRPHGLCDELHVTCHTIAAQSWF